MCNAGICRLASGFFAAILFATAPLAQASAGAAAITTFQSSAYAGDFDGGIAQLDAMVQADASDTEALFGLGAIRFFGAIAGLQKDLYGHATTITAQIGNGWTRGLIPMGSIMGGVMLVPPNPNATPMTYSRLRQILLRFSDRLGEAEATLARVGDRAVKLPLRPFDIAIDLDHNRTIDPHERVLVMLLSGQRGAIQEAVFGVELAFDTADASWLRGYANVLLAGVNLLLAFDFEKSYDVAAHNLYGDKATAFGIEIARQAGLRRPDTEIQTDLDALQAEIAALQREQSSASDIADLHRHLRELPDTPANAEQRKLYEEALKNMTDNRQRYNTEASKLYQRQRALIQERDGLMEGWVFDAVAFLHTMSWDVVDPHRLSAVRTHLIQVMEINKTTWRLVRAETDNDREWLPNSSQTAPFGSQPISDEVIDSWLATTGLVTQILNGEKLLPHPRFNKGLNLKRLFEEGKRFDLVLLITGHDLVSFLEEGETVDAEAWAAITQPMGNHVGQYAIWFN